MESMLSRSESVYEKTKATAELFVVFASELYRILKRICTHENSICCDEKHLCDQTTEVGTCIDWDPGFIQSNVIKKPKTIQNPNSTSHCEPDFDLTTQRSKPTTKKRKVMVEPSIDLTPGN